MPKVDTQVLTIRKNGAACNKPFVVAYEPSLSDSPTLKSIENLVVNNKVVGAMVISQVGGIQITDYVIAQDASVTLANGTITFDGTFGIVRIEESTDSIGTVTLYIGEGNSLSYGDSILTADVKNQGLMIFLQQ